MNIAPQFLRRCARTGASRQLPVLLAIAVAACLVNLTPALADEFRQLSVEQALEVLQNRGLTILYSSDLIQPWMQVRAEPVAHDARGILEEIVAPYAVQVRDGPNGLLVLVRATTPPVVKALTPSSTPGTAAAAPDLEEMIVSASQYQFVREPLASFLRENVR